ncbi:MAG TPA: LysE family translocator [Burkholderiaceae bacterium]|nr:LysE family translocator [Burkholderiaceae bacterium]
MPPTELAALLAYATAMAFTPGPNTTLSAAMGANHGLRHAMRFVVAVPFGWCLLLVACAAGLGTLVTTVPALAMAVRVAGAAYMLWLAWRLARTVPSLGAVAAHSQLDVGFARGVALQFVNGKAWLNALTIAGTWIAVEGQVATRLAWVVPIAALYGLASNFTYAAAGAALRRWLAAGSRLVWFNRVMAAVLAATALWMLRS